MMQPSARAVALGSLRRWRTTHQFADSILQGTLASSDLKPMDRAFTQELFYGVLRNLTLLDFYLSKLRNGQLDHDSRDLLRLGLYQLFHLQLPEHAAVFETVALASSRSRPFINGVLRAAARQRTELQRCAADAPLHIRESHPNFLVARWIAAFGEESTTTLCQWNNQPPPIYARINTLRRSPDEFFASNRALRSLPQYPFFVECDSLPIDALSRGYCYIQDPSTAVAVELLEPGRNEAVLDACAAPGGKTSMIAAKTENQAQIVACDHDPERLRLLAENLSRLGATVEIIQRDWLATGAARKFKGRKFDKIFADVPCSNTGVMRRRADLRWRLTPKDFVRLPEQQAKIVEVLLPLLKPGGVLVYSTCSIEHEENEQVIDRLLRTSRGLKLEATRTLLPFRDQLDGAFAARLRFIP
jgi:16S rRNA (cytosine967-C5)-methyltransferase